MFIALTKPWGSASSLPGYDFTGTAPTLLKDNNGNWELVFLTNCTIFFNRLSTDVDIFVCAGGNNAGNSTGNNANGYALGGDGGRGGGTATETKTLEVGVGYPVVIGGAGQASSAFGVIAAAGAGSYGGQGACTSPARAGGNGTDGVLAFGTGGTLYENGTPIKFGAGGGGGSANSYAAGSGGASGGGSGGNGSTDEPESVRTGKANTGGGGGGGGRISPTSGYSQSPGRGGSGIVIIRNARSST